MGWRSACDAVVVHRNRGFLPLLLFCLVHATAASSAEEARIAPAEVAAAGRHTALVTLPSFGRYALGVTSRDGVSLTVVDRMAGPGEPYGRPGEEDGRVDLFLDRGEIRLITQGDARAKGKAKLSARPFTERNAPVPPRLVEGKLVEAPLADLEQRSYWISIEKRRRVAIEAAGRNLADVRLWRDGTWLHEAAPESEVTMPAPGRPLRVMRLTADLAPGLYLLSAYGGPGEPWAEEGAEHPFHLRWGFPRAPLTARARHELGPWGIDRVLVPGAATFVGLEVPEAREVSFSATPWNEEAPFAETGYFGGIHKKTNPPAASLRVGAHEGWTLVTVRGEAGQPYVLTHFELRESYPVRGAGEHWVGTIPSADSRDAVEETGILVVDADRTPLATGLAEVGPGHAWAGRGNLDGPLTLFFRTAAEGKYEIEAAGVDARLKIAPALVVPGPDIKPLGIRGKGSVDLDAGLWELTVTPVKKGIVTLSLSAAGEPAPAPAPARGGVLFPAVRLDPDRRYTLTVGARPGVVSGLVLRRLPLDLRDPLAVAARPGEPVAVPFETPEEVTLEARTEDGDALLIALDGAAPVRYPRAGKGRHEAKVVLEGTAPRVLSLAARPRELEKDVPLPPLPDGALAALPKFPELAPGTPRALDLDRLESATFVLKLPESGLYRVETTGLLATEALVRTRTVVEFRREAENGTGRNALVADYLRQGDYQATVSARGLSAGHLGVVLAKTTVADGGTLTDGVPGRLTLEAGNAASFRLDVKTTGDYRIRAFGLAKTLSVRVEDGKGWPLVKPGIEGDLTLRLLKGRYRLLVLPQAVPARVVALMERVAAPRRLRGHGPHALALARPATAEWIEPADGGERVPDRFTFTLPAPGPVTVTLTEGMEGRLLRGGAGPIEVPVARGFAGPLESGAYTLETVSARRNSRVTYTVTVAPEALVAGTRREVTAPASIPVAVGAAGLHEIASFGNEDLRARLLDAQGKLVAGNDDRPDDWGFAIARPLAPGAYTLRVEPAGSESARGTVSMRALAKKELPKEALPLAKELSPGRGVLEIPLEPPAGTLLTVTAEAAESIGVSLADADGTPLASDTGRSVRVDLPVDEARPLRLSLFSADGRGGAVKVKAQARPLAAWSEEQLASGGPLPGGAVAVALERPGLFRLDGAPRRVSAARGAAALPSEGLVAATEKRLVLVSDGSVRGARVSLDAGDVALNAPEAVLDLAPSKGPVLLRARAAMGQPGLALSRGAVTASERVALAASLETPAAARLLSSPGEPLADVVLARHAFAPPAVERPERLSLEGAVAAGAARALALPSGVKRLRVALAPGLLALVTRKGEGLALAGALDEARDETLETAGDRITFLSASSGEARFALDVFATGETSPALAPGAPFESAFAEAGTARLEVGAASAEKRTLHVRGASAPPTLLHRDGRAARGESLAVPADGGTLLVPHGAGLVIAWVDRPGSEARDLFGAFDSVKGAKVRPPAAPALSGALAAFDVESAAPALLSLRAPGPAVTLVVREGTEPDVEVHAGAVALDRFVEKGTTRVLVRAAGGGALGGRAAFTSAEATAVREGLGPEVLLGSGQSRLFSFRTARQGAVGIGLNASSELVSATLLSAKGERLGEGLVQMPELAPGTWLLAVRAPADGPPVRIRPALAGIEPPGTGPPPEVVRSYVAPETGPPGASARYAEESEESREEPEADGEYEGEAEEPPVEEEGEEP